MLRKSGVVLIRFGIKFGKSLSRNPIGMNWEYGKLGGKLRSREVTKYEVPRSWLGMYGVTKYVGWLV